MYSPNSIIQHVLLSSHCLLAPLHPSSEMSQGGKLTVAKGLRSLFTASCLLPHGLCGPLRVRHKEGGRRLQMAPGVLLHGSVAGRTLHRVGAGSLLYLLWGVLVTSEHAL